MADIGKGRRYPTAEELLGDLFEKAASIKGAPSPTEPAGSPIGFPGATVIDKRDSRFTVAHAAATESAPATKAEVVSPVFTASKPLPPRDAEMILASISTIPSPFDPSFVNAGKIGGLGHVETLVHPAFIRAAARAGVTYFTGADGKVHRYSIDHFEKAEIEKGVPASPAPPSTVPDASYFHTPPWFPDLKYFVDKGEPILLIGPAGCGKTEATEQVFKQRGQKLSIVSCTPSMIADDMEGRMDLASGQTSFTLASPALAVKEGYGLLLDEADACPAETHYSLYRILDGKDMRIVRLGGEGIVPRHPSFRVVGTQNTEGRGDDRGLHHGRAYQDEAFLDRWKNTIAVTYPEEAVEQTILTKRTGISGASAQLVVSAATALRAAAAKDEVMFACSLRRTISVSSNIAGGMTPERAWTFAIVNRLTEEDRTRVKEVLQRIYGTKLKARTTI